MTKELFLETWWTVLQPFMPLLTIVVSFLVLVGLYMLMDDWIQPPRYRPQRAALERRTPARTPSDDQPTITATVEKTTRIVDSVRDQIGALHMDPLRLLEASSVFDSKNDTSNRFWAAWVTVEDHLQSTPTSLAAAERTLVLAKEAEAAWALALGAAEQVGLSYLPDETRTDAERAAKMLRLAQGTNSAAEAHVAWQAAARVLASLNLAHLRPDAVAALTDGRQPLMLDHT